MKRLKLIFPLMLFLLVGCRQQELLTELNQTQANEIMALLQRNNIDASKQDAGKTGYRILVAKEDFPAAVDLMNSWSLPSKPRVEIAQMFPADSLVSSPVAEKARLYSAIEQRLEQSLKTLDDVISASVHVSYDLNQIEGNGKVSAPHLSALVKYQPGKKAESLLIGNIKRFLKNSFHDVAYEDISVVLTPAEEIHPLPAQQIQRSGSLSALLLLLISLLSAAALGTWFWLKRRKAEQ
ncbi:type III secretion system inner membrane ring lipoprotein SctJ [[Erwinia] mediterraneensis]|uniref:type III secretion system inner membrane ring lipoprotein SctJ n=1 Tax=[Erwinia] mediterraneensis TaxID=2161819 RepID=UPI00103089EE|nr:type III secretion inner membrane ring lipoprotein SctJ [[Erwinia] mediterraneensis]